MTPCRICNGNATSCPHHGLFEHLVCAAGCGEYKITDTEVALASTQRVSVTAMREKLNKHRKRSPEMPLIGDGKGNVSMLYE